uniref:XS domain-containing protein n=1 Tax=Triticum urartu TaxID=4572 RepID=A0A8R7R4U3_TRIUA
MECSSDESSELSDIDIHDYADKAYTDLKSGRLVARFGADRFRCPFCPGKEDCRYNELLQHAIGVGASNHAAEVKANHLALANHLKTDHADAAGSLPPRQAEALMNPPRPLQDQELFVWPWMGILANVPVEETQRGGAIIMQQLAGFKPIRFDAVHCPDGVYTGFAIVRFKKDWIGFKDALGFHNYHKSHHLGKTDWEANKCEKYMFAWLTKEEDYRADDPVGKFLSENGDLKTVAEVQQEMSRKTDTLIARLTSQISAKSKYLTELECKCNQMDLALQRAMEDSDSLNQRYNEEMGKVQSTAREHSLNFFHETDQLRKQLDEKANDIKRRSKQLSEIVAQTDMERRKLENERTKNDGQDDSLDMARIEQEKANESVRILVEKYEKEKEVALIETLQLEKQLDEKRRLELDIQQLRGKLGVVKHMDGEGVDVKKRSEELNKDPQDRIDAAEDLEELNQAPTIKERMTNDEIKLELVGLQGSVDPLGPGSNIGIRRMGQVDEKPFVEACKPKYGAEADAKALELCSMWQDNLRDANWHPFKIATTGEKP